MQGNGITHQRIAITAELVAERDAAAERQEQAAIEAAFFTAIDERDRVNETPN